MLDGAVGQGVVHGLKIVAVAIVAHAVWGMARSLCPDGQRAGIALAAVLTVVVVDGPVGQVSAILIGAMAGLLFWRGGSDSVVHDL